MKIELLSCSVVYFCNFCVATTAAALRRAAVMIAALSQRCKRIPGRKVEQSSECKGSARICR